MSDSLRIILALVAGYLLGSLPSAYLIGKLRQGVDIRTVGSHNMGAMNTFYRVGFLWGVIVLVLDIGKGAAAVLLTRFLFQAPEPIATLPVWEFAAGFLSVVGHAYPVWLKFRGGKGGATVIGVIIALMPWALPIGLALFLIFLFFLKTPTISYGLAMVSFPFVGWLVYHNYNYAAYAAVMILIPFVKYIPRLFEMRRKAGNWKGVFARKSIKDRF
jgi:acyl phosphate:glycerol-3-phosphate acyltransferase